MLKERRDREEEGGEGRGGTPGDGEGEGIVEVIKSPCSKVALCTVLYHTSFMLQQIYMCNTKKFVSAISFSSLAGFGWGGYTCCHDDSGDAHAAWSGPHLHTDSHLCH